MISRRSAPPRPAAQHLSGCRQDACRCDAYDRGYDCGYGRSYGYYDREYKQEFYRGPCKIERKWERNGEYKKETKCKGYR